MKRISLLISVMLVPLLFSAITILAADNVPVPFGVYGNQLQSSQIKNRCLLFAKNCITDSSTVQQRVIDLRKEIAKGLSVYAPDELNSFKEQLKWIESESSNEVI